MAKIKNYRKTEEAAIENVKRFFSKNPDDDAISLESAFIAWGRSNPENIEQHKAWLANNLSHIKYYGLIRPIYSYENARKRLVKLQLTTKGKKAIGRIEDYENDNSGVATDTNGGTSSITDVMKIVSQLQKKHPEFEITFDVKLKNRA